MGLHLVQCPNRQSWPCLSLILPEPPAKKERRRGKEERRKREGEEREEETE